METVQGRRPKGLPRFATGALASVPTLVSMTLRRIAAIATFLSLVWVEILVGGTALGAQAIATRVAGGGFSDGFPMWLRALYAVQAFLIAGVIWLVFRFVTNSASRRQRALGRLVMLMFGVSAVLNAMSRSSDERWNAVGAAIIVVGVGILRRPARRYSR